MRGDSDDYNLTAGARVFKGKMEADRMAIEALESKLTNIYMKPVEEQTYTWDGNYRKLRRKQKPHIRPAMNTVVLMDI